MTKFIEWLEAHKIRYELNGNKTSIFVLFDNGCYVRVTDFGSDYLCYVRDTGICGYRSVFELAELILDYHNKEKKEN